MLSAPPQNPSFTQNFARRGESANLNLWHGLQAAWRPPLGPTGLTLFDQSGYGNHGTLENMNPTTAWVMTEKGWVLDFDGVNDHVSFSNSSWFYPNKPRTYCAWVKPLEDTSCTPFYFGRYDRAFSLKYYNQAYPAIRLGSSRRHWSTLAWTTLKDGKWHHIVWCVRGLGSTDINSAQFYIDGRLQTPAYTTIGVTSCTNFSIGSGTSTQTYCGQLASIAVYDRILVPNEIMKLYLDDAEMFRQPHHYRRLDGLPAVSDRAGRGVLTGGGM